MKLKIAILSLILCSSAFAQSEYEQPGDKPKQDPGRSRSDSIVVINPTEVKSADQPKSKAFEGNSWFKRNFRLGGGIIASSFFSPRANNQLVELGLTPTATVMIGEVLEVGASTSYLYQGSFGESNLHLISSGPLVRLYPFEGYFFQIEAIHSKLSSSTGRFNYSNSYNNVYIGGGWVGELSEMASILTGIKVNLVKTDLTQDLIYPVPFTSLQFKLWK